MDFVSVETIIRIVQRHGGQAVLKGDELTIYPAGKPPVVYVVPATGLGRRIVIQIGQRIGAPAQIFWHPELLDTSSGSTSHGPERQPSSIVVRAERGTRR